MQITAAIAAFLIHRRQRQRAAPTLDQYAYQLQALWRPWHQAQGRPDDLAQITPADLQAYLDYLAHTHVNRRTGQVGLARATVSSAWRTLRAFWRFAAAQGWLPPHQGAAFRDAVTLPPRTPPAPAPTPPPWPALLAACAQLTNPEERARNGAVLHLLAAGLRPAQVAALTDTTADLRERRATLPRADGRVVVLHWGHDTAVALRAYRRVRSGPAGGALLRRVTGRTAGQPLATSAVRRIVQRMARLAGVSLGAAAHRRTDD